MWFKVLVAVLPAMLVGLPLDDWMTEHLHNPPVVAAMLILYGVLFIVVESSPRRVKMATVESLSWATAFGIGLFQVLSLVPGTSRSGATILGAFCWAVHYAGGGIHVLSCHPRHGGCQPYQAVEIWFFILGGRTGRAGRGHADGLCGACCPFVF